MEGCVFPFEMVCEISEFIQEGSTWKALIFTCWQVYSLNTPAKIYRYSNGLATLLKKHPPGTPAEQGGWKWSMDGLSSNPSLPWRLVEEHPPGTPAEHGGWKWGMYGLSLNPSLPWRLVEEHPPGTPAEKGGWEWDMDGLSSNPSLPWR
jgi:hypothetical protein